MSQKQNEILQRALNREKSARKQAEKILEKYQDQDFSYTDAVSFAVMRELKIGKAFAFYSHFSTAGFTTIP